MNRLLLIGCMIVGLCLPSMVLAHVSETKGPITMVMHIDPGDQARRKINNIFQFEVSDVSKNFSFDTCNCEVKITQGTTTVATSYPDKLQKISSTTFRMNYEFANIGDYDVVVTGMSSSQSFSFTYPISVEEVGTFDMAYLWHMVAHHASHIIIFGIGIIGGILILFRKEEKDKK